MVEKFIDLKTIQCKILKKNQKRLIILKNSKNYSIYVQVPTFISLYKIDNRIFLKCLNDSYINEFKKFFNYIYNELSKFQNIFFLKLYIYGLGYKVILEEKKNANSVLQIKVGLSHIIKLVVPTNLKVVVKKSILLVEGYDRVLVGNFVSIIRHLKKPDAYIGKGFWYNQEKINLKLMKKI